MALWSPDSRRVAFIRRPGTPFGLQAHQGSGSIGNPDGPAYNPLTALRAGRGSGGGGRGRGQTPDKVEDARAGLFNPTLKGGSTLSFWVADATTGDAYEFWHNGSNDRNFEAVTAIEWADASQRCCTGDG